MERERRNPEDDESGGVFENYDPDVVELSVAERQRMMSEQLQLMDLLGFEYKGSFPTMYPPQTLSPHDEEELSFLRSLATFVVGNSPQDQLAVTRYRTRDGPFFVFAMNRSTEKEDRDRVDDFFSLIQRERSYVPYMRFALERSPEVLEERLRNLRSVITQEMTAVSDFLEHCDCPVLDIVSLANRLKSSEYPLADIIDTFHGSDLPTTYIGILRSLETLITAFAPSPDSLAAISMSAAVLELMADTLTAELPPPLRNLRLVLSSVARYGLGASILINLKAQYVPPGSVPTVWEDRPPYLKLPPPSIEVLSPVAVADGYDYDLMASLKSSRPSLSLTSVEEMTSIAPVLHAEIRLFSFWYEVLSTRMENIDYGRFRIGSSSDTCACCERWLRAASRALKRGFIVQSTGRFHGDWAISGAAQPCLLRRCDDNAQVIVTQNLVSRFDDWDSYNDISEDAPTETVLQREDSPLGSTVGKTSPTSDLTPSESS